MLKKDKQNLWLIGNNISAMYGATLSHPLFVNATGGEGRLCLQWGKVNDIF